jgi:hypothetical protein
MQPFWRAMFNAFFDGRRRATSTGRRSWGKILQEILGFPRWSRGP